LVVITNIEHDHPDIYPTIEDVRAMFLKLAEKIPDKGALIACGDDPEVRKLLKDYNKRVITYGFHPGNEYVIDKVHISGDQTFFWVAAQGVQLGEFVLRVIGEHNALNALASIIVGLETGLSIDKIKKGLLAFRGSKRRLEYMGDLITGAKVYDDYAHHPTEIKKTLSALRKQYPAKKIICIFQPHTYSRTKTLFDEFLTSFSDVNMVILTDIYASLRESVDYGGTSRRLADAMKRHHKDVFYAPALDDVVQYINENRLRSDTILVTMGAGDVYTIHSKLSF
jgi:UDP-N-acetylmuramate--alanine ligase